MLSVDLTPGPPETVYDISVEGEHEFFADGLLVHNCWQPGQKSPNRLDTLAHLLSWLDAARQPASVSAAPSGRGSRVPTRTTSNPRRMAMKRR